VTRLLQRLVLPREGFAEPELYVRTSGPASLAAGAVALDAGGTATFDTSFGAFAAGRWRRLTSVGGVRVVVDGAGDAEVEVVGVRRGRHAAETTVARGRLGEEIGVGDLRSSEFGTFWVRVRATGTATVSGGRWTTGDAPRRDVRLSLSITTFNRQQYVTATVRDVLALLDEEPSLREAVRVLVVDNARNVEFDAPPGAPLQVVGNGNLGGAGGFARGIMELRRQGWATHVLLMDDDITLEPEALVRTVALFAHARDPRLCVHGAMLSEERPWMQFEAGSDYRFRSIYPLRAVGREDDLRDRSIALADEPEARFAYSAWWYTAFPLSITRDNPLPVFVRGDDVGFGLMHTGRHTVTLNGVVVWHADFALKNNPSSLYYEARNMALVESLVFDRHRWWHLAWRFASFGFRNLFSMRYASTEFMLRGLRDFLAGPEAWMAIDHQALHDELRRVTEEKPGPLPPELAALPRRREWPKPVRLAGFVVAVLLVGGYVLPPWLRRKDTPVARIDARAVGLSTFRNQILHRHERASEGYLVRRDGRRFARLAAEIAREVVRIAVRYRALKRRYRAAYAQMVSDEAWDARFAAALADRAS
jgi:galactofuranosylgalactofuranosylrhamnosyl-N-acetylglucosaminyl-diphospho-decaprenol beta-1,5/1,6-galactofuranosyltransferase